ALAAVVSMFIGFEIMGFIGLIIGPTIIIIIEALQKAGFLKNWKIDF
ncbi:MAG TPA: sporulation integral membrane protein YtvI, partial [Paenibacillaceae bacterium]|nr:sporulation integral membrane protein YtvI [Paenibacillaceae bacterium]